MQIRQANLDEEIQRDRLTADAWGEHLGEDDYLKREHLLRSTAFGKTKKTWLAVEDGEIVSSCESYETKTWYQGKAVSSLGLASVYTEPKFRGKGYASKMLLLVSNELKKIYPSAIYWIGFSEVGAAIYQRIGFQVTPHFEWVLDVSQLHGKLSRPIDGVELLTQTEVLEEFYQGKTNWFTPGEDALLGRSDAVATGVDQTLWLWEREAIYRKAKGRHAPSAHAARIGKSGVVFTVDAKQDSLWFINIFSEKKGLDAQEEIKKLIHAAIQAAIQTGIKTVEIWEENPFNDFGFLEKDFGLNWIRHPRSDTIPIVLPLQAGADVGRLKVVARGAWL